MAMMYRLARRFCEPRDISAFVTDAIVCHPSNAQRKKLEAAALAYKHPDGTNMFRIKPNSNVIVCASDPPVTPTFEFPARAPPWVDYFVDDPAGKARAIVMRGESVFLQGYGGHRPHICSSGYCHGTPGTKEKRDLHIIHAHGQSKHRGAGGLQWDSSSLPAQTPNVPGRRGHRRSQSNSFSIMGRDSEVVALRCQIYHAGRLSKPIWTSL